jgi:hypothetical protein
MMYIKEDDDGCGLMMMMQLKQHNMIKTMTHTAS